MRMTRTPVRARLLAALLCTFTAAGCGPNADHGQTSGDPSGSTQNPVVYGTDNRQDVYAHPDAALRDRAMQSTVALMYTDDIDTSDPNNVEFYSETLGEYYGLCSNQRFFDDPTPAWCSGTLIDDDLVLTAGHCITSAAECAETSFVFNFYRTDATTLKTVTTSDIFKCKSIVTRRETSTLDYGLIRLDRPATPRFVPAPVRPGSAAMTSGANVAVIGSGSGVPFKIDSGGSVRNARATTLDYFIASTDTFGGNSGSGVYETGTYTVAGILVRGETDYVRNGSCYVVNVCTETGCGGEDITYVRPAITAYCAVATSERLCNTTPPPQTKFSYTATNTLSATVGTTNKVIALTAGQKLTIGTCGVTDSAFTDDTYLRLFNASGVELASNDDGCGGRGSKLTFTVPAGGAGNYEIRAGCYAATACTGTVAWTIETGTAPVTGSLTYTASATNNARQNTTNRDISLTAGQTLSFGTCTVEGASGTGDTYLRLYNSAGQLVVENDDACGVLSYARYTVPTGAGGTYQLRAGCESSTSCGGTVAWTIQ